MIDWNSAPRGAEKAFKTEYGEVLFMRLGVNNIVETFIDGAWRLPIDQNQMLADAHRWSSGIRAEVTAKMFKEDVERVSRRVNDY